MGIIWPNMEFPGNPQRIMKKHFKAAKNRDGRTIINRHTFFGLRGNKDIFKGGLIQTVQNTFSVNFDYCDRHGDQVCTKLCICNA